MAPPNIRDDSATIVEKIKLSDKFYSDMMKNSIQNTSRANKEIARLGAEMKKAFASGNFKKANQEAQQLTSVKRWRDLQAAISTANRDIEESAATYSKSLEAINADIHEAKTTSEVYSRQKRILTAQMNSLAVGTDAWAAASKKAAEAENKEAAATAKLSAKKLKYL